MSRVAGLTILAHSPTAYTVEVDGEAVILDEGTDRLHLLNGSAALIWACIDGESTLADICADIADVLGAPYDQVLADTCAVAEQLISETLLVEPGVDSAPTDLTIAVDHGETSQTAIPGLLPDGRIEDHSSP